MPTIEIISINSNGLNLKLEDFEIAIIEDKKLESHRGLFYDMLKKQQGTIVHIGNPEFKFGNSEGFFAGQLIDWAFESLQNANATRQARFKFLKAYNLDIGKLLIVAIEKSPNKEVYFLTDYQFGPENAETEAISSIVEFWDLHDNDGLAFNTLYVIKGNQDAAHNISIGKSGLSTPKRN